MQPRPFPEPRSRGKFQPFVPSELKRLYDTVTSRANISAAPGQGAGVHVDGTGPHFYTNAAQDAGFWAKVVADVSSNPSDPATQRVYTWTSAIHDQDGDFTTGGLEVPDGQQVPAANLPYLPAYEVNNETVAPDTVVRMFWGWGPWLYFAAPEAGAIGGCGLTVQDVQGDVVPNVQTIQFAPSQFVSVQQDASASGMCGGNQANVNLQNLVQFIRINTFISGAGGGGGTGCQPSEFRILATAPTLVFDDCSNNLCLYINGLLLFCWCPCASGFSPAPSGSGCTTVNCDNCPNGAAYQFQFDVEGVVVGPCPVTQALNGVQTVYWQENCVWETQTFKICPAGGGNTDQFTWLFFVASPTEQQLTLLDTTTNTIEAAYVGHLANWDCDSQLTVQKTYNNAAIGVFPPTLTLTPFGCGAVLHGSGFFPESPSGSGAGGPACCNFCSPGPPPDLQITFTGGTGDCACVSGVSGRLVSQGCNPTPQARWLGTLSLCGHSSVTVIVTCTVDNATGASGWAISLEGGFCTGNAINVLSVSCTPFQVVFDMLIECDPCITNGGVSAVLTLAP